MQDLYNRSQSVVESQQKLELFISCRSLANMDTFSKSDPYVILYVQRNNKWAEYGRTETIMDNLNPNFSKTFIIEYFFECKQPLRFEVNDYDGKNSFDRIGSCETTLATIAGAKDQLLVLELKNNSNKKQGTLIIRADQVKLINDKLVFQLRGEKLPDTRFFFWHTINPFLRFFRIRKENGQPLLVHETEYASNNQNPRWKRFEILSQKLCNGDYNMPIKVELWDYRSSGAHVRVGETQFTVSQLQQQPKTVLQIKGTQKANAGRIIFDQFVFIEKPSFVDYLQGGTQINLVLAVDFTASNINPQNPNSLHYIDPTGRLNQYQAAILAVGEILLSYDHDKKVPLYGFGCQPKLPTLSTTQTLHCFPLNGNPSDPEVYGLDGIMQTYNFALRNVSFDGPTYFNPIIQESMKIAKMCKDMASDTYFVLLILTDGEIHDMKPTINSIIASSHLPLSIIIVGVGNADFTNMEVLDDDDGRLMDDSGKKTQRDLVQFVPFNQFKENPELLAKNVLQELPDQLVDYMLLVNKKPKPKQVINIQQFGMNGDYQQFQPQQQYQAPPAQQLNQPPPPYQPQQMPQYQPPQQMPPQQYQQQIPPSQYQPPYQQPIPQQYPPTNQPQGLQNNRFVAGFANSQFMNNHINQVQYNSQPYPPPQGNQNGYQPY